MSPVADGARVRKICNAGNLINTGIESSDFAEIRKALDACIELLHQIAATDDVDSYLIAKLTLAFTAGLAITEQSLVLSEIFELGRSFNDDNYVFMAKCQLSLTYDGMNFDTPLSERDLRLLAMGIFFTCHSGNLQLLPRDAMVMLQIRVVELVLQKRLKTDDGTWKKSDDRKIEESFLQRPYMILEYLRHDDRELTSQLIAFWEYTLHLAYGMELPEQCGRAFAESLRDFPYFERHNHIRLLPMLPWQIEERNDTNVSEEEPQTYSAMIPAASSGWFGEMPEIGRPIKIVIMLHFFTGLLAIGMPGIFLWSGIAITLGSIFYRTCLNFKEDLCEGNAPVAVFLVYLFAGFMSIGAFEVEGLVTGMVAAMIMHLVFPGVLGVLMLGRRKMIEGLRSLSQNNRRRLK